MFGAEVSATKWCEHTTKISINIFMSLIATAHTYRVCLPMSATQRVCTVLQLCSANGDRSCAFVLLCPILLLRDFSQISSSGNGPVVIPSGYESSYCRHDLGPNLGQGLFWFELFDQTEVNLGGHFPPPPLPCRLEGQISATDGDLFWKKDPSK